jgi:hypothetical protein
VWTLPYSFSNLTTNSLKFTDLTTLNVQAPLFRRTAGIPTNPGTKPVTENTKPPIVKDSTTVLVPIYSGFLFELPGSWSTSSLTKVNSLNRIVQGGYLWLNDKTYIFSDSTTRTWIGQQEVIVTNENNFGFFDYEVTKVVSNGLTLDFTQVDGELLIVQASKSCKARIGDVATVYFELEFPVDSARKNFDLFSTAGLNLSLITQFTYQNKNFYLSNELESGSLINTSGSKFLIIR